jgi:hypothetical protein
MFSLQENWRTRRWNRFCLEVGKGVKDGGGQGGEVAQTMYTHMNKCKNNKKEITLVIKVLIHKKRKLS